jgi:hypothetical protein
LRPERIKRSPSPSEGLVTHTGLVSLDTFYKYKKEKDYENAKAVMVEFLETNPDNFTANIEMAYLLLRINEYKESIPYLKKAYTLHNNDPEIALQIAYTYDHLKETDSAEEYYTIAVNGSDPFISEKAQAELDAKRGAEEDASAAADADKEKKCEGIFDRQFLEFYADSVYYNRFTNWVFSIDLKLGVSVDKNKRHQVYAWLWQVKDTKSAGGTTPAIFSDPVAIVSIGYRYRLIKDKYAFLYANFGEAYDLIYRNRSISRGDFRAGLYFYDSWKNNFTLPGLSRGCYLRRIGDIDFNFTYYSRYRYWIGYAAWREGISLYDTKCSGLNVYLRQFLAFDTVGEFFNNIYELGPVVEIHPYKPFPIKLLGGWVQGFYYKSTCSTPNPYGPRYTDLRFQAIIWTLF